jgi:hypothetical protein
VWPLEWIFHRQSLDYATSLLHRIAISPDCMENSVWQGS